MVIFTCHLCTCAQVITCLVCDADACARCYTCTCSGCANAAATPRPAKTLLQEWEDALPGAVTDGTGYTRGAVETPRSAGSGWDGGAISFTSMTVCFNGRELRLGPGTFHMESVPGDDSEHRT